MDTERLQNLLVEFDRRLTRLSKGAAASASAPRSEMFTRKLSALQAETRRQQGKIDRIRLGDVERLESLVAELRREEDGEVSNLRSTSSIGIVRIDDTGIANLLRGLRIGLSILGPDDVLDEVPGQKVAPFQFDFDNDVLKVVDQPMRPVGREADVAEAALSAVMDNGEFVLRDLEKTNVSPRLRESLHRLQTSLSSRMNIVQSGMNAQMCSRIVNAEVVELSNTHAALLLGHLQAVFNALAQFKDWRIYCENAMFVDYEPSSISVVADSARKLSKEIQKTTEVDLEVSEALATVSAWAMEDPVPDKRDSLSLVRTLENIWSVTVKAVLAFGKDVISEGKKRAAQAILTMLISTFGLAVPVIARIPGAEWVQIAYDYLKALPPKDR